MKDKLGGKIMKVFVGLRAKTYNYLTENNDESKKAKRAKKCVILRKLKFEDYKNCLEATQLENKIIHQSLIEKMNLFQYKNMMKLKKKSKILTKNAWCNLKNNNIKLIFTVLSVQHSQKITILN